MNGIGHMKYDDGSYFKGMFKNDMKNGKGTFTYPNGKVYEGTWLND